MLQRSGQFEPSAAHVGLLLAQQANDSIRGDSRAGFLHFLFADQNPAFEDERLRPRPAGNKSPLNQQKVHACLCAASHLYPRFTRQPKQ
jgi:hypothetical protein